MKMINTIEEMEEFIDTHECCELTATKKLEELLSEGLQVLSKYGLNATEEQKELFFKVNELSDRMLEKGIRYRVGE